MPARVLLAAALLAGGCTTAARLPSAPPDEAPASVSVVATPADPIATDLADETENVGARTVRPPAAAEPAPPPSPRVADLPEAATLAARIEGYYEDHSGQRGHIQTDKPLYKPGETIWFKAWTLAARSLALPQGDETGVTAKLVSPKGAVVLETRVRERESALSGAFDLPADVPGGEYTLKMEYKDAAFERGVVVASYEPPRLKQKLEFLRKAFGEGDEVSATFEVKRPTGEPLAKKEVAAAIQLDGSELPRLTLTTNADGGAVVRFRLPEKMAQGDGLLTVLVDDGGVTESISRRIPIVLKKVQLSLYPEGGKLVEALESRLYFEARTPLGKPADVAGRIVDDLGNPVATFESYKNGLGRVTFTPATGRRYHAELTRPTGISERYTLPLAESGGCVLRTFDDPDTREEAIRVRVACTEARRVVLSAMIREMPIDAAVVDVREGTPAIIHLSSKTPAIARAQGVARITLFDDRLEPLAERVVFRNRRGGISIELATNQAAYTPREQVKVELKATDSAGTPLQGAFAVSAVDDTVVSFADDKSAHLLSKLLLDPEMPRKIEEPNFYFDTTEPKSALAMELLMGTWGHTQFAWREVKSTDPDPQKRRALREERARREAEEREQEERRRQVWMMPMAVGGMPEGAARQKGGVKRMGRMEEAAIPMAAAAMEAPMPMPAPPAGAVAPRPMRPGLVQPHRPILPAPPIGERVDQGAHRRANMVEPKDMVLQEDRDWKKEAIAGDRVRPPAGWAPVRVFPLPAYVPGEIAAVRSDFRETVFWNPNVRTGTDGRATFSFPLSDAVTSFRLFAEGAAGGLVGRSEKVFSSTLPLSLSAKLPVEVSAGDRILLPVTLSNELNRDVPASLDAVFGEGLRLATPPGAPGTLSAHSRKSLTYPLEVTATAGRIPLKFKTAAGAFSDELSRELTVTPLGFPQLASKSGQLSAAVTHELDLAGALPGSIQGTLKLYPSPVATMLSGLDGMLRQPFGCFEQTSSTNYPNVMITQYLREHDVADTALLEKSAKLIDEGYRRLVGFESPKKGYEWFGGDPGHEALTAYGLVEFDDMRRVFGGVDDGMIARTANWLKSRRDGQGGYLRDPKALDSFGRADPEVTNAYITWSLAQVHTTGIEKELAVQAEAARSVIDAYRLALAAHALLVTPPLRAQGLDAARRLAALQDADGAFSKASHSITRSGGLNLTIETTSLAVLALLEAGGHDAAVRKAVEWLTSHRGGFGEWGATQATVLALKAMTAYANASRKTRSAGRLTLLVNGTPAGEAAYAAGQRDPIVIDGFGAHLMPGRNRIELRHTGDDGLPFTLAVEYRSKSPASSPDAAIGIATALEKSSVKMGETVRANVVVSNRTQSGQPMTLARVGLPGGLSFQTWQLKELREKGLIAFWENRGREVILYFRDLKPGEEKRVPLELVATVPGSYTGPASSAYLYYTDEHKSWAAPLAVEIAP